MGRGHGKNLTFDFSDEAPASAGPREGGYEDRARERWQVGEPGSDAARVRETLRARIPELEESQAPPEFGYFRPEDVSAAARRLEVDLRGRSYAVHSAGFLVGIFALLIFGFGILSLLICGAPLASADLLSALPVIGPSFEPPVSPARRVALSQIQARYTTIKDGQRALVISGSAENVGPEALGTVQIEASLLGAGQQMLRGQAVYCGNNLSPTMIGEMTPHELEFFEKLDSPKSFTLAPQASAPFVVVFISPPAGIGRFQLRVAKADIAAAAAPASSGG
jgi:Protein of unknown function (DUF3426)